MLLWSVPSPCPVSLDPASCCSQNTQDPGSPLCQNSYTFRLPLYFPCKDTKVGPQMFLSQMALQRVHIWPGRGRQTAAAELEPILFGEVVVRANPQSTDPNRYKATAPRMLEAVCLGKKKKNNKQKKEHKNKQTASSSHRRAREGHITNSWAPANPAA